MTSLLRMHLRSNSPTRLQSSPSSQWMALHLASMSQLLRPLVICLILIGIFQLVFSMIKYWISSLCRQDPHNILSPQASSSSQNSTRPTLKCDSGEPFCGYQGPSEVVGYKYNKPCTSFQVKCRRKPTSDLQHYTRTLQQATVERWVNYTVNLDKTILILSRVVNVPLYPGADYRRMSICCLFMVLSLMTSYRTQSTSLAMA